jgi:hypothetical protein
MSIKKAQKEFNKIINEAVTENEKFISNLVGPLPPAMDPFNLNSGQPAGPYSYHSAEGQWQALKELGRRQEVQDNARRLEQLEGQVQVPQGCAATRNEPKHVTWHSSLASAPLRTNVDYPQLFPEKILGDVDLLEPAELHTSTSTEVFGLEDWEDLEVEMVLDSGCCVHILDATQDAPGYTLQESEGSRNGRGFIAANGDRIPNEGEVCLNLEAPNGKGGMQPMRSTFQSSRVSRPLMSVSQICDHGFKCIFDKTQATVVDSEGKPRFVCERKGGLYTSPMKVKAPPPPAPFQRQAP